MKDWQKVSVTFFIMLLLWFAVPVISVHMLGQGTLFGWLLSVCGILLTIYMPKWIQKDGKSKKTAIIFISLFSLGMFWCGFLSFCMFLSSKQSPPKNCLAIVLGCKVSENGKPSIALQTRINRAEKYLKENPKAMCIASGAKGKDEPVSEADVIKSELVKLGVSGNRIIVENRSENTAENLKYSAEIIKQHRFSGDVAIVTDEYHQFRARKLAERENLKPYAISAHTPWTIFPTCYGRELLSLTNWFVKNKI